MEDETKEVSFSYEVGQTDWCSPKLLSFLDEAEKQLKERKEYPHNTEPSREKIFRALRSSSPKQVKVLLIGQDVYHSPRGTAMGYAFSVESRKLPPSLQNIFKEMRSDGIKVSGKTGNLKPWVEQGVLLLNTSLTTKTGTANAHHSIWNEGDGFTKLIVEELGKTGNGYVAILWGRDAQKYKTVIQRNGGTCLCSAHPSPFSATSGFFGSKPFSKTNALLRTMGKEEIDWSL